MPNVLRPITWTKSVVPSTPTCASALMTTSPAISVTTGPLRMPETESKLPSAATAPAPVMVPVSVVCPCADAVKKRPLV